MLNYIGSQVCRTIHLCICDMRCSLIFFFCSYCVAIDAEQQWCRKLRKYLMDCSHLNHIKKKGKGSTRFLFSFFLDLPFHEWRICTYTWKFYVHTNIHTCRLHMTKSYCIISFSFVPFSQKSKFLFFVIHNPSTVRHN